MLLSSESQMCMLLAYLICLCMFGGGGGREGGMPQNFGPVVRSFNKSVILTKFTSTFFTGVQMLEF